MNSYSKLSYAIAAILGGSVAGLAHAATATDTAPVSSDSIQEITVTAQRRTENIQDVPIAIQALTAETLTQLQRTDLRRLRQVPAERDLLESTARARATFTCAGLSAGAAARLPVLGFHRRLPERRGLPRRSIGAAAGPQPRHLRRRPGAHRGARRSAGHALRRRCPGRRGSLHHEQAQAQRDRRRV